MGEEGGVGGAEGAGRRGRVEDVVAQADADRPGVGAGEGEDAVGQVVRTEGVAFGDVEGGHGVLPRSRACRRSVWSRHTLRGGDGKGECLKSS